MLLLRTVAVTRYVTPLREGGSLPAIVEADDGFLYVLKFRGAGQGLRALIADLIGAEMARKWALKVPEVVFASLLDTFSKTEPDEEIQDLLKASVGLNLGIHYLQSSITYDPIVMQVEPILASKIVLLDYILTNVDRTARNTNMLVWHKELWLIDFGASLYFHHSWDNWEEQSKRPFAAIKDHVLLAQATEMEQAAHELKAIFQEETIAAIVSSIPDEWLLDELGIQSAEERRQVYKSFLVNRIEMIDFFVKDIENVRQSSLS